MHHSFPFLLTRLFISASALQSIPVLTSVKTTNIALAHSNHYNRRHMLVRIARGSTPSFSDHRQIINVNGEQDTDLAGDLFRVLDVNTLMHEPVRTLTLEQHPMVIPVHSIKFVELNNCHVDQLQKVT